MKAFNILINSENCFKNSINTLTFIKESYYFIIFIQFSMSFLVVKSTKKYITFDHFHNTLVGWSEKPVED